MTCSLRLILRCRGASTFNLTWVVPIVMLAAGRPSQESSRAVRLTEAFEL